MALLKRRVVIPGYYDNVISPPNDFTLPESAITNNFYFRLDQNFIDENTNYRIRNIGVFSNFADGLVPKNPGFNIKVSFGIQGYEYDSDVTGTSTPVPGSKIVTGVGTNYTAELSVNDTITEGRYLYHVASVDSNTQITLREYVQDDSFSTSLDKLSFTAASSSVITDIPVVLNAMHPVEEFIPVEFFSSTPTYIGFYGRLSHVGDIDFLTKSISTDYDGDSCFFDIYADVEYTE